MSKKTTAELVNELRGAQDPVLFLEQNDAELADAPLASCLRELLAETGTRKADVIRRSGLHEVYAYQIFDGRKTPARDKVLALCFAFPLSLEQTQTLLKHAGLPQLYPRHRRDAILIFALGKGLSVMECNELLYEMKEYVLE